jgi:hypothetical protein
MVGCSGLLIPSITVHHTLGCYDKTSANHRAIIWIPRDQAQGFMFNESTRSVLVSAIRRISSEMPWRYWRHLQRETARTRPFSAYLLRTLIYHQRNLLRRYASKECRGSLKCPEPSVYFSGSAKQSSWEQCTVVAANLWWPTLWDESFVAVYLKSMQDTVSWLISFQKLRVR